MAGTVRGPGRRVLDGCDPAARRRVHPPGAWVCSSLPRPRPACRQRSRTGRSRTMKVRCAAFRAPPATLAAPAAAHASGVAVQGACFVTGAQIPLTGFGFTPGSPVSISGDVFGSTVADPSGNISAAVAAPVVSTIAPKRVAITVTDTANPANRTGAFVNVIRDVLLSNAPISGRPRAKTTWRFAGFPAGTAIYGHYRFHGRTMKNYRFGKPTGPCGTLTVRARRVPVAPSRLRSGTWTLQLDQRQHYRRSGARRVIRFRI